MLGQHRQGQHKRVRIHPAPVEQQQTRDRDRDHEDIDGHQIGREQPGGFFQFAFICVLNHRHMELARQADDRCEGQQGDGHPFRRVNIEGKALGDGRYRAGPGNEIDRAGEHEERNEHPGGQKRHQLDDRFKRDRPHHTFVVFRCIHITGAEHDRENRHQQCDHQSRIRPPRGARYSGGHNDFGIAGQHVETGRDRFQLQRDIGQNSDHHEQGDNGGERLAFAKSGGDEIGDRGDVLGLADPHDLAQHHIADGKQQHRPQIDRDEIIARVRSQADAAIESPGRAVDRQGERIDHRLRAHARAPALRLAIPPGGDREEDTDIAKRRDQNGPVVQHVNHTP